MMKLRDLIAKLRASLTTASTDEEKAALQAQLKELESVEPDAPAAPAGSGGTGTPATMTAEMIADIVARATAPLQQQVTDLSGMIADERQQRESSRKVIEDQQAAARTKEIETTLDDAIAKGKIPIEKRDEWKGKLDAGWDIVKSILDELPESKVVNNPNSNAKKPDGEKADDTKKYDNKFARSMPSDVMKYVEESIADT
jgi:hypothetical protein